MFFSKPEIQKFYIFRSDNSEDVMCLVIVYLINLFLEMQILLYTKQVRKILVPVLNVMHLIIILKNNFSVLIQAHQYLFKIATLPKNRLMLSTTVLSFC